MRTFTLEPRMRTTGGVFYPTGYMVLMFPTAAHARAAAARLEAAGLVDDEPSLIGPDDFQRQVAQARGDDDQDVLASPGTEGETARRFLQLARQGHHALLVHTASAQQSDQVMAALRDMPISCGQRYGTR